MKPNLIKLDHGCGMGASYDLLKEVILPSLGLPPPEECLDSALLVGALLENNQKS